MIVQLQLIRPGKCHFLQSLRHFWQKFSSYATRQLMVALRLDVAPPPTGKFLRTAMITIINDDLNRQILFCHSKSHNSTVNSSLDFYLIDTKTSA